MIVGSLIQLRVILDFLPWTLTVYKYVGRYWRIRPNRFDFHMRPQSPLRLFEL